MGIAVVAADGRILAANSELERLLGYTRDELLGNTVEILIPDRFAQRHPGLRLGYAAAPGTRRMGQGRELLAKHRDGSSIPVEVGLSPVFVSGETLVVCTVADVSERRRMEATLLQTQRMETIGNLAAGVAHDFNNLLLGILGHAEIARESSANNDDARECLDVIIDASTRARKLVDRLLGLARRGEVKREPLRWSPILVDTLKLIRVSTPRGVVVEFVGSPGEFPIIASALELQQIAMNLVANAIHATSGTGGTVLVTLSTVTAEDSVMAGAPGLHGRALARLTVADNGTGIASDVIGRIFEPFFTTKSEGEGTGLGLFVAKRVIESLGGFVRVTSEEGHGATFDVYLPIAEPTATA